jgi:hypothetical protein
MLRWCGGILKFQLGSLTRQSGVINAITQKWQ